MPKESFQPKNFKTNKGETVEVRDPASEPEDDGRMSSGAAQDEANMLRARMNQSEAGTIKKVDPNYTRDFGWNRVEVKPTKSDYDDALEAVEWFKRAAAKETDNKILINKIGRYYAGLTNPVRHFLDSAFGSRYFQDLYSEQREGFVTQFEDATFKLQQLREKGEGISESQG